MTASSNNLDSLVGVSVPASDYGGLSFDSVTTTGPTYQPVPTAETVQTTAGPGPGEPVGDTTVQIAAVNDANNTVTLVFDEGGTAVAQVTEYVVGFAPNALLLSTEEPETLAQNYASNPAMADENAGVLSFSAIPPGSTVTFTSGGMTNTPPCYCRGTMILTDRGEIAVEELAIGDRVITCGGAAEPIRWIGRSSYAGRFLRGRPELWPVRIKQGALGGGLPTQDLLVSPKHAMLMDGVLVPAASLIDGIGVVAAPPPAQLDYFHVELSRHDVIWANGAASETFVDDGSRASFSNASEFGDRYPDHAAAEPVFCAPRLEDGAVLEGIRRRVSCG